ncbi:hypothetical protein [Dactylosporangium salmoneum]|uniref:Uncharacterized protein n=1 Tax=Dactylosporangium salmoneum TaxID=53361 RepID=A0ABN3HNM8_9ACTN
MRRQLLAAAAALAMGCGLVHGGPRCCSAGSCCWLVPGNPGPGIEALAAAAENLAVAVYIQRVTEQCPAVLHWARERHRGRVAEQGPRAPPRPMPTRGVGTWLRPAYRG